MNIKVKSIKMVKTKLKSVKKREMMPTVYKFILALNQNDFGEEL